MFCKGKWEALSGQLENTHSAAIVKLHLQNFILISGVAILQSNLSSQYQPLGAHCVG